VASCPPCGDRDPAETYSRGQINTPGRVGLGSVIGGTLGGMVAGTIVASVVRWVYWGFANGTVPSPEWSSSNLLTGAIIGGVTGLVSSIVAVLSKPENRRLAGKQIVWTIIVILIWMALGLLMKSIGR
jgi:H+/Cl- antiporter ClcA